MCYLVSYPRNGKTKIVDGMWDEKPLTNTDMMSMEHVWMAIVAWMTLGPVQQPAAVAAPIEERTYAVTPASVPQSLKSLSQK